MVPMSIEKRFDPRGRQFAPIAFLLGTLLVLDAIWCVMTGQLWAAVVVGGVGLERLVYAATDYWHRRLWPYRLRAVRLGPDGLVFEEHHAYGGPSRTTTLPGGLILDARMQRGVTRDLDGDWAVLIFTILGTIVWSQHKDEADAERATQELRAALAERSETPLAPPAASGAIDVIPKQRGVMWGKWPLVPVSIAVRSTLLLATIVALPNLAGGMASAILWGLTALTALLLAFPFVGAVRLLRRRGSLMGFGLTAQFGELRSWEHSAPRQVVPLSSVRHVGFGDLELDGGPLAIRLVAHTEPGTLIDVIVPRSAAANLAEQACRLVAELHDVRREAPSEWTVPMPGGLAEAIEAVSWAQRFVAEARNQRPDDMDWCISEE